MENCILVKKENDQIYLTYKTLKAKAVIGKNGFTDDLVEGDMKTPIGEFDLGIAFGLHERSNINLNENIPYFKIQKNHYWIDDINSKFYNQLIEIDKEPLISGEHLIDFANDSYEYAIEIKVNPHNIINKGSAIMLHCCNKEYTYGCVGIAREDMIKLFGMIDENTKIKIGN